MMAPRTCPECQMWLLLRYVPCPFNSFGNNILKHNFFRFHHGMGLGVPWDQVQASLVWQRPATMPCYMSLAPLHPLSLARLTMNGHLTWRSSSFQGLTRFCLLSRPHWCIQYFKPPLSTSECLCYSFTCFQNLLWLVPWSLKHFLLWPSCTCQEWQQLGIILSWMMSTCLKCVVWWVPFYLFQTHVDQCI